MAKSSQENDGIVAADDDNEDGVSLGTLKLPGNTDLNRFESLLFQVLLLPLLMLFFSNRRNGYKSMKVYMDLFGISLYGIYYQIELNFS